MISSQFFVLVQPVLAVADGAGASSLLSGIGAVLLTAALVALVVMGRRLAALSRTVRALEEKMRGPTSTDVVRTATAAPAAPAAAAQAVRSHSEASLSTEIAVVIAAAVAATYGRAARIVSVQEVPGSVRPWSLEGRRQIFASHSVR